MRYARPKYVVTSVTALGGLLFGYDIGIMSSILQMEGFNEYFDSPDALATGVIVSSLTIGCFLGSLLSGPLADRYSRKITIMLGALVCTVGSCIQFASISRAMLIAGRFVNGLAIGFLSSVVPMYQSETAPPGSRGRMVSLQQWAITWGIFLAFGIDYGCSYIEGARQFRLPLGLQIVPSIVLLFTMALMPFSPRWLVAHDHIGDARQVLGRLRAYGHTSAPEVTEELRLIHQTIAFERATKTSSYWELLRRPNRRRTLLGCGIQFMQQFTGINTLMLYSPAIFRSLGLGSVQSIAMFQAINGLVNVSSTVPAILWIDRWGRRPTLLVGTVLIIVSYLVLSLLIRSYGALTNLAGHESAVINLGPRGLGIAAICMVYLVVASFAFSWGPCGWLIPSEIFPTHLRAKANSVTTGTNWISNFVVTLTSPLLLQVAGWRLFLAFSVVMAVNLVLIYLFLPETKNLTLEEMDTLFASSVWAFRSAPAARKAGGHCCSSNATTTTTAPSLESYELSTRIAVSSQVRWETGDAKPHGQGSADTTDAESAAMLLLSKRDRKPDGDLPVASDRQTVRPPAISGVEQTVSSDAKAQARIQPSTAPLNGQASASTTVSGIPRLTDLEEAKLEKMRAAQWETRDVLSGVMKRFSAPIRYAFAYGSGVYKQAGYGEASKPMVDLIFAVSHPDHWHALNISQNRSHYSFMGTLGSNAVAFVQDRLGAGVYYNPFIEIDGVLVKYGVVSIDTLSSDLLNWDTLYLAGRMHKPTLTLRRDPLMRITKQVNLTHAVRAALLMLPKNFSNEELFRAIASLSFAGDFRMKIGGENPQKVHNIVEAQMPLFKSRYGSIIEGLPNLEYIGQDLLQQDMSPQARAAMVRKMPNNFYDHLVKQGRKSGIRLPPGLGAEAVNTERLVAVDNISGLTTKAVESIVARPALTQSIKGILSSGLSKSIAYMYSKNSKYRSAADEQK